jgi:hypothetical protein
VTGESLIEALQENLPTRYRDLLPLNEQALRLGTTLV